MTAIPRNSSKSTANSPIKAQPIAPEAQEKSVEETYFPTTDTDIDLPDEPDELHDDGDVTDTDVLPDIQQDEV